MLVPNSVILDNGTVMVPDQILKNLSLKEGSEIVWNYDQQTKRVFFERRKPQTISEFDRAEVQSRIKSQLLSALKNNPQTFNELLGVLKVSSRTLAKVLKECQKQGFVEHKARNKPYSLTKRGIELLQISEHEPLEGNDVIIEIVQQGPFTGSIILRLPSRIGREFSKNLYTPTGIEDLCRIMIISLEFWVMKHLQKSTNIRFSSLGKDFNGDGIEDLIICETPREYPNIRKALKENTMPMPLWDYCLEAAEEKLSH